MIIICSCACISPASIISSDDGHDRNREYLSFKSFISSLSQCQCTSMSQGTICPLEWAVFWMVSASVLFLRTNRVIIPSKGEDGAIKHARKGRGLFNVLRCFRCNYSAYHVMPYLSVSMEPTRALPFSPLCAHVHGKKWKHGACVPKSKEKQAEAKVSCSILICLLL